MISSFRVAFYWHSSSLHMFPFVSEHLVALSILSRISMYSIYISGISLVFERGCSLCALMRASQHPPFTPCVHVHGSVHVRLNVRLLIANSSQSGKRGYGWLDIAKDDNPLPRKQKFESSVRSSEMVADIPPGMNSYSDTMEEAILQVNFSRHHALPARAVLITMSGVLLVLLLGSWV